MWNLVRDQGVGGSNPLSPTILFSKLSPILCMVCETRGSVAQPSWISTLYATGLIFSAQRRANSANVIWWVGRTQSEIRTEHHFDDERNVGRCGELEIRKSQAVCRFDSARMRPSGCRTIFVGGSDNDLPSCIGAAKNFLVDPR